MGVGKLVWAPSWRALTFDETQYLKIVDTDTFDLGTADFRIALLFWPDSTAASPTTARQMVAKWDGDLTADTGYWMGYKPSDGNAYFSANDGGTPINLVGAAAITNDAWNLMVIEGDRDGNAVLYVNGAAVDTEAISSIPGTLNKATSLLICRNNTFKGKIGYLAFSDTVYGADYALEEYYEFFVGLPRQLGDRQAVWTFADTLWDLGEAYVLSYEPSGAPTYAAGYPDSITLNLNYNFTFAYELDYLPLDTPLRAPDGTGLLYKGPAKRRAHLPFDYMSLLQKMALEGAWYHRSPIDLYIDQYKPRTFTGMMVSPPQLRRQSASWWSGAVELEEL